MGSTKDKLRRNQPALGGWIMIGHSAVAELMASEGFDWLAVDLEHTSTDLRVFYEIALTMKGGQCDLLARLQACDPVQAKQVLDAGATGIIVPMVNTPGDAVQAVAMAKFPPEGSRGAAFSRASNFGRDFPAYYRNHNESVIVVVMIEHLQAIENLDGILATPGLDAIFVGPYDLSASMGLAGELDHPQMRAAMQKILDGCARHKLPAGIHVIESDPAQVQRRITEGYRFIACSIDTEFILQGSRRILGKA